MEKFCIVNQKSRGFFSSNKFLEKTNFDYLETKKIPLLMPVIPNRGAAAHQGALN